MGVGQALSAFAQWLWNNVRFVRFVDPWQEGVRIRAGRWWRSVTPGPVFTIPFIDRVEVINVKRQVVDLEDQTVESSDGVPMFVSLSLDYSIRHAWKVWLRAQNHDASIMLEAQRLVAAWINATPAEGVTIDELLDHCGNKIRAVGWQWGCEIHEVGVNNLARHDVLRLVMSEVVNVHIGGQVGQ